MDSAGQYLNEIARFPLLTAGQEIQLGRQVKKYVELRDLPKDQLNDSQKRQLRAGLRAKEKLSQKQHEASRECCAKDVT
jgi:hypothetical protein